MQRLAFPSKSSLLQPAKASAESAPARRRHLLGTALLAASALWAGLHAQPLQAQTYPQRPITVVTPFPAGGATDVLTRLLGEQLSKSLGQAIVVENRAGAATTIGASQVARARPDGYTLLLATNSTLVTNRYLFKQLPYDPDGFEPIGMIAVGPLVLLTSKKRGFKDVKALVDHARQNPDALSVASFGAGSSSHLATEYFEQAAGIEMTHVPFKGATQALPVLANGEVDAFFDMVATGMPQVQAGRIDVLAITSPQRLSSLPDLPTLAELGYPGFEMTAWFTLVAPKGTPADALDVLRRSLQSSLQNPELRKRIQGMGLEPADGTPAAMQRQVQQELPIIEKLVKRAGVELQ